MKKYNANSGWFNESHRHKLASLGVKTGRKSTSKCGLGLSKINYAKPFKTVPYAGHWVNKEGNVVSFNLYSADDIDFDATKDAIMDNMNRKHLMPMKKLFSKYGIELKEFRWYSPREYNFAGDSVDLVVKIKDKEKLKKFIKDNRAEIQKRLDSNKSYDGYMALTAGSVQDVLDGIDNKGDVDTMVVSYIQEKYPLDEYEDLYDLLVNENEGEKQ